MMWIGLLIVGAHMCNAVRLSSKDYDTLLFLPSNRAALPAGFKHKYVGAGGVIKDSKPSTGSWIEVGASPLTSATAHYEAALIISRETRHMPPSIFTHLASYASAGVFTKSEKLTIYPEFYHLKDSPQCKGICTGHCSASCTFDGRKWETVAGAGGRRAVVLDDNVLCTSRDPYHHHDNILVHEFSHAVQHSLNHTYNQKVITAYNHAKSAGLWSAHAYSMANYREYFADGTASFFNVNRMSSAGGMNKCGTSHYCDTEAHARAYMKQHDRQLYDILAYVFTDNKPDTPGHLNTCQKS